MYQIIRPKNPTLEDELLMAYLITELITQDPYPEAKFAQEEAVGNEHPVIVVDLSNPIEIMHYYRDSKFGPNAIYITRGGFVNLANPETSELGVQDISIQKAPQNGELIRLGMITDLKEASRVISRYLLSKAKEPNEINEEHLRQV